MSKHSEGQEDLSVSFVSFLWTLMPRQGLPSQTGCKERRQTWSWLGQAIDWLMRRQNTLEVRDWGRKKSSLILAGCWGKAGGGRQAVFVTLLILGQQEKLHWHHPHTTGEGKMAIWPSYPGTKPAELLPCVLWPIPGLHFQAKSDSSSWKKKAVCWFLKVE